MDIKGGRFFAQYGVEANDAVSNALSSRSYTFIYDPFTHTGLLTTTKLTDAWSVQAGLVLGCDVFIDSADNPDFIGSIKWAPPGGRDSAVFGVILGKGEFDRERNFHNPEIFDLFVTHKINSLLNYTLEIMYVFTTKFPNIITDDCLCVTTYFTYTLSST